MPERRLSSDVPSRRRRAEEQAREQRLPVLRQQEVSVPECETCIGLCCGRAIGNIFLYPDQSEWDRKVIADGKSYTDSQFPGHQFIARRHDGACVFLSDDNRCTIYNQRPFVCRQYTCLKPDQALGIVFTAEKRHLEVTTTPPYQFAMKDPRIAGRFKRFRRLLARLNRQRAHDEIVHLRAI